MVFNLVPTSHTPAFLKRRRRVGSKQAGLSLVELLVVTAIMVLISGTVLANNNKFGGKVLLQNLAYDVALTIREAQVYGISVQRFSTNTYARAYGVYFVPNAAFTQGQFALFADVLGDVGRYNCPNPATADPLTCELIEAYTMRSGYRISEICVPKTQVRPCTNHTRLDITFKRPNPDAIILVDNGVTPQESARIYVTSPQGDTQAVVIEANGQIAVE